MSLFGISNQTGITMVKCPASMDHHAAQELLLLVPKWIENPAKLYVKLAVVYGTEATGFDIAAFPSQNRLQGPIKVG